MILTGRVGKYGQYATKEDKRKDIIAGLKKYLAVGDYHAVYIREKRLMTEYGMTPEQIENEIYA